MINTERVMDLTEAYLHSYKLALSETRNSQLAMNVAFSVTHIIASNSPAIKEEKPAKPFETLIAAFANGAKAACEQAAEEEDDGEEETE